MNGLAKGVYNPKAFILHAASLGQTFVHCPIFLVAATRRCTARVSVQLWLIDLSVQLPVIALVGLYPTNKLIGREPSSRQLSFPLTGRCLQDPRPYYKTLSANYPEREGQIVHVLLTRSPLRNCAKLVRRATCMPNPRRQRSS